jgi:hypothetical protein
MIGQSGYKAPRSSGPMGMQPKTPRGPMGMQPKTPRGPMGMQPKTPRGPMGMATRPPLIANKARGTMSSATYSQIPASMSGMGQSGMAAQGSQAGMGIPQPQGSFTGPAKVGPKRIA